MAAARCCYLLARPACMTTQNPLRAMLEATRETATLMRADASNLAAASASSSRLRATSRWAFLASPREKIDDGGECGGGEEWLDAKRNV